MSAFSVNGGERPPESITRGNKIISPLYVSRIHRVCSFTLHGAGFYSESYAMSKSKSDITYTSTAEAVSITIKGNALVNLRKIAEVINNTSWGDRDNTDISILESFVVGDFLYWLSRNIDHSAKYQVGNVGEITAMIADGIDTGHELDTPQDKARRDELRTAFEKAGL